MNPMKLATVALVMATAAAPMLAAPAYADTIAQESPPVLVAQDTTPAPATIRATVIGIDANAVGALSVTGHGGKRVTATAKGQRTRTVTVPANKQAVLRNLAPGVRYVVAIAGRRIGTAVPLAQVGAASQLSVQTTGVPGAVRLTWTHAPAAGEGPEIAFEVTATPLNADGTDGTDVVTITATGTSATLESLVATARYRFTVTPRNTASAGRTTSATMTRTLSEIAGPATPAPAAPTPGVTVTSAPAPAPGPAPAPAPAPAPQPTTKTIYVCPDGYTEAPTGTCQKTLAYTFHAETVTLAYTYHNGVIGSHVVTHPPTHCDYLPNPNSPTGLDIYCTGGYDETVLDYGNVKDATPTGYTDTGTAWVKTIQVKAPAPTGYTDTGTAWVKTVGKVAQVVPA
jgi:hypothetical protein